MLSWPRSECGSTRQKSFPEQLFDFAKHFLEWQDSKPRGAGQPSRIGIGGKGRAVAIIAALNDADIGVAVTPGEMVETPLKMG